jgi:hypothetical protein
MLQSSDLLLLVPATEELRGSRGSPLAHREHLTRRLFADHHLKDGRVERPLELAADEVGARPGDFRMERFQPRKLEPHVRSLL